MERGALGEFFAEEAWSGARWVRFFAEPLLNVLMVRVWCVRSMCGHFSSVGKNSHAIPLKASHVMNLDRCNSAVLYLLWMRASPELHARLR